MKILVFILLLLSNMAYSYEINPTEFIQKIINECKPALIKENNSFLEATMEKYIDFNEIAIWISGKNTWKEASSKQRDEFLKELKELMLKTYSKTVYYYIDADVEFMPSKPKKIDETSSTRIQISSIMRKNNKNITIAYRLIRNKESWLVFDVIIEGISILKSLKTQFSEIIRMYGLDEATQKIHHSNSL